MQGAGWGVRGEGVREQIGTSLTEIQYMGDGGLMLSVLQLIARGSN